MTAPRYPSRTVQETARVILRHLRDNPEGLSKAELDEVMSIDEQMGRLVENLALHHNIPLWRKPMVSEDEVMRVTCPIHGVDPCWYDNGRPLRRGCMFRQIEACRADREAPALPCAGGDLGSVGCLE